uniref:SCP domain-containing protein n=1 Tax=Noctiluca scintillans TaxID=2966 RepID=A0A7S1FGJ6_NOCSC
MKEGGAVSLVEAHASVAHADLQSYIDSLVGKQDADVSCTSVCEESGLSWVGWEFAREGTVGRWTCHCQDAAQVNQAVVVECVEVPFSVCCKDRCEVAHCGDTTQGWSCPANGGCASGTCNASDWSDWVAAHNVFRCMHDVPPLSWSDPMGENAVTTFQDFTTMEHSDCYSLRPPLGPSAENLFRGGSTNVPMDAVAAWYEELSDCGPFPGCDAGHVEGKPIGHFTVMVWQGASEIGCFTNTHGILGCRYKGPDYITCRTPNYGEQVDFEHNVFPRVKTYEECRQAVETCGFAVPPVSSGTQNETTGVWTK